MPIKGYAMHLRNFHYKYNVNQLRKFIISVTEYKVASPQFAK
jgi:hypothetical protein